MMRPSKSASAWNLTRMPRPLQLGTKFGVRLPRLPMLRLRRALPVGEIGVDFFLVREVKCKSAVHLIERQCRITLDHAFRRHTLAEEIGQRIERYTSVRKYTIHIR